jgi:hypothetical protein
MAIFGNSTKNRSIVYHIGAALVNRKSGIYGAKGPVSRKIRRSFVHTFGSRSSSFTAICVICGSNLSKDIFPQMTQMNTDKTDKIKENFYICADL